jgi:HPt (histidine-containing phosphotransfer) domain-containing protein
VQVPDTAIVLDRAQLRDVTLDDEDLMREILTALIDDTSRQMPFLESAISEEDSQKCMRLAHYSKGACANVGANAAAAVLKHIERQAASREFPECRASLVNLAVEIERLRLEAFGSQAAPGA